MSNVQFIQFRKNNLMQLEFWTPVPTAIILSFYMHAMIKTYTTFIFHSFLSNISNCINTQFTSL
jgi:hypothetical protein